VPTHPLARVAVLTAGAALALAGCVLLYFNDPRTSGIFPPCPFFWLTGFHCPGCGSTRALYSLLHGRIGAAIGFNPVLVFSIPVIGLLLLKPELGRKPWVPWCAFVVLVAHGVLRNIPVWPFVLLGPG
jgi:Protein of unknown function (DUF2752)